MEIIHQIFKYTPSNLSDFIKVILLLQFIKLFAAECLKMKLFIDICTVLCRILNLTDLHELYSRSKHRPLCKIDSLSGQAWWTSFDKGLKI